MNCRICKHYVIAYGKHYCNVCSAFVIPGGKCRFYEPISK